MASKHIKYQLQAFERLRELQTQGILCDLVLMSHDQAEFKVHASVMVAACESFYGLLCERGSLKKIRLNNVCGHSLGLLIRFIYGESFHNPADIQILAETLRKLGMKHLNQFVETCGQDFGILDNKKCVSGNKSSQSGISHSRDVNCQSPKRKFQGDNSCGNELMYVKSEPLSPTENISSEGTGLGNLEKVQVKSEPIDTSYEATSSVCERVMHRKEDSTETNGSLFLTDTYTDLRPMRLYVNEKHVENNHKNIFENRSGSSQAEESGVLQDLVSDWRRLPTEHVEHNQGFNGVKSEISSMECHKTVKPLDKTISDCQDHQKAEDSLLRKNITEPDDSKRVPVFLRQIDDQGNYAIFPVSPADGAGPLVLDTSSKISRGDKDTQTAENTDMRKKSNMLNNDIPKQIPTLVKYPINTVPGPCPSTRPVMVNQPQIASGHQIILSPNGHVIAAANMNVSSLSLAGTSCSPAAHNKCDSSLEKSKRKGRQKVIWPSKRGRIREIIPKTQLQIQNVVSLSTNVSEPSQDCASKRMKEYFRKCQALDHDDSVENTEGCQEPYYQQTKEHGDERTENCNEKTDKSVFRQVDSAKRKSGDSGDFHRDSMAKKLKELNMSDEDDEEYLVIDLKDIKNHLPHGKGTSLNVSGDDIFTTTGMKSNKTDIPSSDKPFSGVISVSGCTLEELSLRDIPHGIVFPSKTKTKIYTGRKLNFFHSEEEAPPQRKRTLATKITSQNQAKAIMSLKSKCPNTQSQVAPCAIQPVMKSVDCSKVPSTTNSGKAIPIVVALANGKTATVMVPGYSPDNKLEVPLTAPVAAPPDARPSDPTQTSSFSNSLVQNPKVSMASMPNPSNNVFTSSALTSSQVIPGMQQIRLLQPPAQSGFISQVMSGGQTLSNSVPISVSGSNQAGGMQNVLQHVQGQTLSNSVPISVSGSNQAGGMQNVLQHVQGQTLSNSVPISVSGSNQAGGMQNVLQHMQGQTLSNSVPISVSGSNQAGGMQNVLQHMQGQTLSNSVPISVSGSNQAGGMQNVLQHMQGQTLSNSVPISVSGSNQAGGMQNVLQHVQGQTLSNSVPISVSGSNQAGGMQNVLQHVQGQTLSNSVPISVSGSNQAGGMKTILQHVQGQTLSNSLPISVSGSNQAGGMQNVLQHVQRPVLPGSTVVQGGIQQQQLLVPNLAIQNSTLSVPAQYLGQQPQMRLPTIPSPFAMNNPAIICQPQQVQQLPGIILRDGVVSQNAVPVIGASGSSSIQCTTQTSGHTIVANCGSSMQNNTLFSQSVSLSGTQISNSDAKVKCVQVYPNISIGKGKHVPKQLCPASKWKPSVGKPVTLKEIRPK
ncbi:uncharacterized protein LOC124268864 [Haliotis rubra]|uniref:uncharacterized protein LOC124268864 n=1 Tax=Haliotis rubra TaxID=36100 RepID=UPI001EE51E32|nr:uncharacterized protein LOC124268864 [Haliotis rubra]